MRLAGEEIELAQMRFGFPPASARGGPVFNYRLAGRHFDKGNGCLIPASASRIRASLPPPLPAARTRRRCHASTYVIRSGAIILDIENNTGAFRRKS